jgi:hypothetical protein
MFAPEESLTTDYTDFTDLERKRGEKRARGAPRDASKQNVTEGVMDASK